MDNEQMYLEIILDARARIQALERAGITIEGLQRNINLARTTFAQFASQMIQRSNEIVMRGFERIRQAAINLNNAINKTFKAIDQGFRRIFAVTSLVGGYFIKLASDAQEMQNKFNVVFGDLSEEVDKWANGYGKAINRSKNTIKGMLTENQDLFVGMGMSRDGAKEFSKAVVTLTNDLASFNNLDTKRASELMMSSLMGESQAARSLGANILETQLNVTALQMGYKGYSDKMDEVTKMTIRYNTILRQNGDALGDSIRTANDWANVSRGVIDNLKELAAIITSYLLPSLAETATGFLDNIYLVKDFVINNKELVVSLLDVGIGFLKLVAVVWIVIKAYNLLTSPIFYTIAALALLYVAWETNFYGIRDVMQEILDFVKAHPILSAFLGFTAFKVSTLVLNYTFALIGPTLATLLNALMAEAGLTVGAIVGSSAALTTGAFGLAIISGFAIGVGISILSGGAKSISDYCEQLKYAVVEGIKAWKEDKKLFFDAFFGVFEDAMKSALKAIFAKPLSWFGIDGKVLQEKGNEAAKSKVKSSYTTGNSGFPTSTGYGAFDTGGYTGQGGKYDIAGVVHKGEYVIPKWMVSKNMDIISQLESQRLRGFAPGGGDVSITRRIANGTISILEQGGRDKDGVREMTNAINALAGIIDSYNFNISGVNNLAENKIGELEQYKSEIMGKPEGSIGNGKGGNDTRIKEIFDFNKEKDKFFKELTGLGIEKPDLKYFEEYQQFLESSLKKMIDDDLDTTEIANLIKENKSSLEGAKKDKEKEELLKKQAEDFKNLMQSSLENAMSSALESNNINDFKSTLGDSAYETLKTNMIKAFSESKVYQDMFSNFFKTDDIKFTGNLEEDMKMIQSKLEEAKEKLNANGLLVDAKKIAEQLKETVQGALESAITNAFEIGNLSNFKNSLGDSIYENLKANLIKAFSESKIYQDMFSSWFKTDDIKFTGNMEEDFKMLQTSLKEYENKLNEAGLTVGTNKIKEEKEKFNRELSELSGALSSISSQLNNEFLNALSLTANGMISFMNSMATMKLGGLNTITGALGVVGAVVGVVQGVSSMLDSKRDAKNDAQLKLYEENTKALENLGDKMDDMMSNFSEVADTIVKNLSKNPTLARTAQSSSTLNNMLSIIDSNKEFGKISFVADYKKKRLFRSDAHRKETFTIGDNIDDYSYEQLKTYREQLNKIDNNTFAAIANGKDITWDSSDWGDVALEGLLTSGISKLFGYGDYKFNGIESSNLEQYKKNIDNYLKSYEKIMEEQKELMRTSTLESFDGIEKLAEDELRDQYKEMFEDMGLDPEKYKKDIDEMVKANSILVTATDDVRSSWISAVAEGKNTGEAVLTSLSSYFSKMINNISSVLYDVDMSNFDNVATDYFGKFSEILANAKIKGEDVISVMKDYLKSSDTSDFIDEILNVKEANKNIEEISKTLREELKKAGLTDEDIDNLGIIDSTRQKFLNVIEDVKNALKSAISNGLESGSLVDFRKSLGDSIYSSAKEALITAFSESAIYKEMFAKWFETSEVNFTGNLDEDFKTMEELLYKLRTKLRENDMDSTIDDGNSTSSSSASSSYYTGSSNTNNSGTTIVENHYHFDFSNSNVYNKEGLQEVIIETTKTTKKV